MTRSMRYLAPALLLALACAGAAAATFRVDDSGTVLSQPVTPMRWRQLVPSRNADPTVEGRLNVALRLNLSAWVNRPARIYMVLAPTEGQRLTASWRTQGRLLPGALRGGDRTVVFDGLVRDAFLAETLELSLVADGRQSMRMQSLHFHFEIEVSP
jgi:hypothetical protein